MPNDIIFFPVVHTVIDKTL